MQLAKGVSVCVISLLGFIFFEKFFVLAVAIFSGVIALLLSFLFFTYIRFRSFPLFCTPTFFLAGYIWISALLSFVFVDHPWERSAILLGVSVVLAFLVSGRQKLFGHTGYILFGHFFFFSGVFGSLIFTSQILWPWLLFVFLILFVISMYYHFPATNASMAVYSGIAACITSEALWVIQALPFGIFTKALLLLSVLTGIVYVGRIRIQKSSVPYPIYMWTASGVLVSSICFILLTRWV